jgi:hypothetical protein
MASAKKVLAAQSWCIEYMGDAIDDARKVDGIWYRREIITKKFAPIVLQDRIVPLFKNPPRPAAQG